MSAIIITAGITVILVVVRSLQKRYARRKAEILSMIHKMQRLEGCENADDLYVEINFFCMIWDTEYKSIGLENKAHLYSIALESMKRAYDAKKARQESLTDEKYSVFGLAPIDESKLDKEGRDLLERYDKAIRSSIMELVALDEAIACFRNIFV